MISAVGYFLYNWNLPESLKYNNFYFLFNVIIPGAIIGLLVGVGVALIVALAEYIYRQNNRAIQKAALAANDSARHAFNVLKSSLENEMAEIQRLRLPKECELPESLRVSR